jgi:translation initiation factor 2 alpha subunit (eIF-2alpha)
MFYNQKETSPVLDTVCFVKLADYAIKPNDLGVYVKLIDYDDIDGFIPLTEINKYKVSIQKIFKHDKIYPCLVSSYEKDLINLSYMRIKEKERERLLEQFNFAQRINTITELVNEYRITNNLNEIKLLESYMYDDSTIQILYDAILESPSKYFGEESIEPIKNRIKIEPSESLKEFQLIICQEDGLNILKKTLKLFQSFIDETYIDSNLIDSNLIDAKIECISSPIYAIRFKHLDNCTELLKELFNKFEKILENNMINAILTENELKTYKQKSKHFSS